MGKSTPEQRKVIKARYRAKLAQDPERLERARAKKAAYDAARLERARGLQRIRLAAMREDHELYAAHREASNERNRQYRERYARDPDWRARETQRERAWRYRREFGISIDEYDEMAASQGDKCALCGGPPVLLDGQPCQWLDVDHCHTTGRVRGLLCKPCNSSLGKLGDSPEALERVVAYLSRPAPTRLPTAPAPTAQTSREKLAQRKRKAYYRSRYGISLEEYEGLLTVQGGLCAVCSRPETASGRQRLNVDHDHETRRVRGLLCASCNSSIGRLGDTLESALRALAYLAQEGR